MLATLRSSERRWFELRVEPLIPPTANRAGEQWAGRSRAAAGMDCTAGRAGPPALGPRRTRRELRSGPLAPLRKLLLRVLFFDPSVVPSVRLCGERATLLMFMPSPIAGTIWTKF